MVSRTAHLAVFEQVIEDLEGVVWEASSLADALVLYGFRVLAASEPYFRELGFKGEAREKWFSISYRRHSIGKFLDSALYDLMRESGVRMLAPYSFKEYGDEPLAQAISKLDKLDAVIRTKADATEVGAAISYFLTTAVKLAKYVTPDSINNLAAQLLLVDNSIEITSVYDPACGLGGSLIALNAILKNQDRNRGVRFYGQEVNQGAVLAARWNLLLNGITDFDIRLGDTLREPKFLEEKALQKFDVVVAVPPLHYTTSGSFGSDPYNRFSYGEVSGSRADYAFVQHALASLKPEGRATVVIALSALSRTGFEDKIRAGLVHDGGLRACIGLPENLIPGSAASVALLVFERTEIKASGSSVFFFDATEPPKGAGRATPLTEEIADRILDAYVGRAQDDLSAYATADEIKERRYNLAPPSYTPVKPATLPSLDDLDQQIRFREVKLQRLHKQLGQALDKALKRGKMSE